MTKFWIGVACKEHVENGVTLGICQFCHGKSAPAKRLSQGDFVIYYSSKHGVGHLHWGRGVDDDLWQACTP